MLSYQGKAFPPPPPPPGINFCARLSWYIQYGLNYQSLTLKLCLLIRVHTYHRSCVTYKSGLQMQRSYDLQFLNQTLGCSTVMTYKCSSVMTYKSDTATTQFTPSTSQNTWLSINLYFQNTLPTTISNFLSSTNFTRVMKIASSFYWTVFHFVNVYCTPVSYEN